jgi:LemA protein
MVTATAMPQFPKKSFMTAAPVWIAIAGLVVVSLGWGISTWNALVQKDQQVRSAWAQVENAYQRRTDLVPNLVETVKGAANFEKTTFIEVAAARTRVAEIRPAELERTIDNAAAFQKYQTAQAQLSSSLGRLIAVAESNPSLQATANFRDLQAQLEGTENRITVERMRFNEAAGFFNTLRQSFPSMLVVGLASSRFSEKHYFESTPGSDKPPAVKF